MTQLSSKFLEIPSEAHGLLEFGFFLAVGITAGTLGLI
tara:strand:+ start:231 stop:344 length:114 start_codon:yes stop_codon:yes gene_type:complete